MYSELENRNIVVIDIDKEIIGRRGSIRKNAVQNKDSKFSSDPHPFTYTSV